MSWPKITILAIIMPFLITLTLGVYLGMYMDGHGNMMGCPFMDGQAICKMSIFEHLSRFQQIFTYIPQSLVICTTLIVFLGALLVPNIAISLPTQFNIYRHKQNVCKIFNTLLLAFSDGILQPKLYA